MLASPLKRLKNYSILLEKIRGGEHSFSLEGLWGSSKSLLISSLFDDLKTPSLIIAENPEEAEKFFSDFLTFLGKEKTRLFPFPEVLPSEELKPPAPILHERLKILGELEENSNPKVIVAPIQAVLPKTVSPLVLKKEKISLAVGNSLNRKKLIEEFLNFGYERAEIVEEKNNFTLRAGIIDIFPSTFPLPVRIEISREQIASLRLFDPGNQRSVKRINSCEILPKDELNFKKNKNADSFLSHFPSETLIFLNQLSRTKFEAEKYWQKVPEKKKDSYLSWDKFNSLLAKRHLFYLSTFPVGTPGEKISFLTKSVESVKVPELFSKYKCPLPSLPLPRGEGIKGRVKIFFSNEGQKERFEQLLQEKKIPQNKFKLLIGNVSSGFSFPEIPLTVLTDHEIFSRYQNRRVRPLFKEASAILRFDDLKRGDYLVHINEGVGRFLGLKKMNFAGRKQEFISMEYAGGTRLYLPVSRINLIQKYVGSAKPPRLSTLGTKTWLKTKQKITGRLRDLASELLEIYAYRKKKKGFAFSADTDWQREFEHAFIYEETLDQKKAVKELKRDMENLMPMDRLLCGDVGYGKTEVAMRASFKSLMDNKQVALLVPTTILAIQHLTTFKERFADYPVNIELLSRFKTKTEQKRIIQEIKQGKIDIIIGTHRLLGEDIKFSDLGLLIIDEEQRFGVIHKEKLRVAYKNIDILALSATPIPRTLHLSLAGIRDLSQINTPPKERLSVVTYCAEYNESLIREAVLREMERGGQVYYLHNRVYNIQEVAIALKKLLPEAKIGIVHGQLPEKKLEEVMLKFIKGEINLLLATTIIESGLDIPNANTIIIEGAEDFGLADLYQLRGRVGRYKKRAYAYVFISRDALLTSEAKSRLKAIEEFSTLGSGLKLAIRDLEIRGAGNILGREQHGFIETVGFHLYVELLRETTAELLGQPSLSEKASPFLTLDKEGYIPESYIGSETLRINLYRRLFSLKKEEVPQFTQELEDRFGAIPEPLQKLL